MVVKVVVFAALCVFQYCVAIDNLRVVYQWKQVGFAYNSPLEEEAAIQVGDFIPGNNIPLGLEVAGQRIFITVPRWKRGVPASLTYIHTSDSMDSPKLRPYPNWEAHKFGENNTGMPDIVSPFRLRADRCGNLWVLDSGTINILEEDIEQIKDPELIVFDVNDDTVKRRYTIPSDQYDKSNNFFANIAVEDNNCRDLYAYLADISGPSLVVYSWNKNAAWQVKHPSFNIDPAATNFSVSGITFQWSDGIFGLALSATQPDGNSDLYFHPMTGTEEFVVSTKYLKDPDLLKQNPDKLQKLGSRGPKGQSSVSFLDKTTGVLFYALVNLNAIACWKTTNPNYTMQSQGRVYMSNVTMVFPNDIKVDAKDNLWVLSDRLPIFMYSKLDLDDVNFRVLTAPVKDAIKGTACDAKVAVSPEMVAKMKNHLDSINPVKAASRTQDSNSGCSGVKLAAGQS